MSSPSGSESAASGPRATQAALVSAARGQQGITVQQAAIRSDRTAEDIEAVEVGLHELPTHHLRELLMVLGEDLVVGPDGELDTRPLTGTHDPEQVAQMLEHPPDWRLAHALDWNEFAGDVYLAGRAARGE